MDRSPKNLNNFAELTMEYTPANMESLPQEIYDSILRHVVADSRAGSSSRRRLVQSILSVVSRKWQRTVERRNFRHLTIDSDELDQFNEIMTTSRRGYSRILSVDIILPMFPLSVRHKYERQSDRDRNDMTFSSAMHTLFHIIKSWDDESNDQKTGFRILHIRKIYSVMDHYGPRHKDNYWKNYMRHKFSYISLVDSTRLPFVHSIGALFYAPQHLWDRKLAPRTLLNISARLPCLTEAGFAVGDHELYYPAIRRRNRGELADAFRQRSLPASVQHFEINLINEEMSSQRWRSVRLLPPNTEHDPLCCTIREATSLTTNLSNIQVRGVLDLTLLWPPSTPATVPVAPFWQNLARLFIDFDVMAPSGERYFQPKRSVAGAADTFPGIGVGAISNTRMPPGYNSTAVDDAHDIQLNHTNRWAYGNNMTQFGNPLPEVTPYEPLLEPLIEAFARACKQIPTLRNAVLRTDLWEKATVYDEEEVPGEPPKRIYVDSADETSEWGIYFAAPGDRTQWSGIDGCDESLFPREDLETSRLTFNTRNWHPDRKVCQLLRSIGVVGASLVELHVDLWDTVDRPALEVKIRNRARLYGGDLPGWLGF